MPEKDESKERAGKEPGETGPAAEKEGLGAAAGGEGREAPGGGEGSGPSPREGFLGTVWRRGWRLAVVRGWLLAFAVGLVVGAVAKWTELFSFMAESWEIILVVVLSAAAPLVILSFVFYRWKRPSLEELGDFVTRWREIDRERKRETLLRILTAAGAYVAFSSLVGIVLALLINFLAVAQLGRFTEQNRLLETQNAVITANQRFQTEREAAQRRYDEIVEVLSNLDASIGTQVCAVQSIPEAMLMQVHVVTDEMSTTGALTFNATYPNLVPLRRRFQAFIREDRVGRALAMANVPPIEGGMTEDQAKALKPLGQVSDAIARTLHRLGPPHGEDPNHSLWRWDAQSASRVPACRDLLSPETKSLDLRHVSDLDGAQLPFLLHVSFSIRSSTRGIIKFADRVNMQSTSLQRAFLFHASLRGARLELARLQGADLLGVSLQGADLYAASLQGRTSLGLLCRGRASSGLPCRARTSYMLPCRE